MSLHQKSDMQKKWINIVFDNMSKLENRILRVIENHSFDASTLEDLRSELQLHYGAIDNLRKSFKSDTYFVGHIQE